jgi:hypothetical protein
MNFIRRLIDMAAPAQAPVIGDALSADVIEATEPTAATDASAEGQNEKVRLAAILNSEDAIGREQLARHLALHTELSPSEAQAILTTSARESSGHAPKELPQESAEDARQRQLDVDFAEALRKAEYAAHEPSSSPASVIERMQAAYAFASNQPVARK